VRELEGDSGGGGSQQGTAVHCVEIVAEAGERGGFDQRRLGQVDADAASHPHPPDAADDVDQFSTGIVVKGPPDFDPDDVCRNIEIDESV
jgi:hypothetical protein